MTSPGPHRRGESLGRLVVQRLAEIALVRRVLAVVVEDRPDGKGRRVSDPWRAEVLTPDQQRARWSKTSRCYTFRLQSAEAARGSHLFTVTYAPAGGGARSFDHVVLTARAADDATGGSPTTKP